MKKFAVFIAVIFGLCCRTWADTPPHDVLAHCSGDWAWFAHVSKATPIAAVELPDSAEQTELFARHNVPGEQWRPLPTMTGRAVALASRSSQLAILMKDGQWWTVWSDGSSTGQPLPGGGRIKTIADDGTDLWAVGAVNGGIIAANAAIIREGAATRPTTAQAALTASTQPVSSIPEATAAESLPPKLVLFRQYNGRWATIAEFPVEELVATDDDLSFAVVGDTPLVAFRNASGGIRTIRYTAQHVWQSVGEIRPVDKQAIAAFRILSDGFKPLLWITTGNDPGELFPDASQPPPPTKLQWTGSLQLDGIPAAAFAGGYVCVFGPHASKVLEQRYESDGRAVETAAELIVQDPNEGLVPRWLEVVVLAFAGFSFGANMFRQWTQSEKGPAIERSLPAPLPQRFAAGLIDALPVIGAGAYLLIKNARADQGNLTPEKIAIILGGAIAFYLLHTALAEAYTGRSAGKWLLGLKVVNVDGTSPTRTQAVWRNVLRLVDPLVTILVPPLRQRTADTVMGTMVVRVAEKPTDAPADQSSESGGDKPDSQ